MQWNSEVELVLLLGSILVLYVLLMFTSPNSITSKLKILQIIMWNIGMAQKVKETRSGCLVHIVQ